MADGETVEVRYAGAVVVRSAAISDETAGGFFLGVTDPLPVGTIVSLTVGGAAKTGRVESVVESPEVTLAGMRIRYVDGAAARPGAAPGAPESAPASDDEGALDSSGPVDGNGGGGRRRKRRR